MSEDTEKKQEGAPDVGTQEAVEGQDEELLRPEAIVKTDREVAEPEPVTTGVEDGKEKKVDSQEFVLKVETARQGVSELEGGEHSKEEETKTIEPKLSVSEDDKEVVEIEVFFSSMDGKVIAVSNKVLSSNVALRGIDAVLIREYSFTFSSPDYDTFSEYRRAASFVFRGTQMVDRLRLRNFFFLYHLLETNFPFVDEKGEEVKFVREADEDGDMTLSPDTSAALFRVKPIILELVLSAYERISMLQF